MQENQRPGFHQPWLIPYENPLKRKLGREFFASIPRIPGVYTMLGADQSILYIGKAKNLRNRLLSYQRATPEQVSRKVIRMLRLVEKIRWEECASEEAALLRENELLRMYRPPFNVVNVSPESYYFIGLKTFETSFILRLTTNPNLAEEGFALFGAYKGRSTIREGYQALLRLIWLLQSDQIRFAFPARLASKKPAYEFELKQDPKAWVPLLSRFLNGTSKKFLESLTEALLANETIPPFIYRCIQDDLERLEHFFLACAHRNKKLRNHQGLKTKLIAQHELDDLLVIYRLNRK